MPQKIKPSAKSKSLSKTRAQLKTPKHDIRQMLETILDQTHILIAYLDPKFNFILVNRAYAEADERESSFYPGKNHFDLFPNAENEQIFRQVIKSGKSYFAYAKPFEYAEHPERGVSYWDWSLVPHKDKEGNVIGLILSLANVTPRIQAEQEVRKLHRAVEQSPVSLVITDPEGKIEYVNPKFVLLTGYTTKEVMGKNPDILKSGKHPPEFYKELWKTIKRGQDWHGEFCNKKKNGELYWESALISPVKDEKGSITHFIGIKEDITERKQTEEKLRESEKKHRQLIETLHEGIWVIDKDVNTSYVNPRMAQMLGYTVDEMKGKHLFTFMDDRGVEICKRNLERRQKGIKEQHEFEFIKKDGTRIYTLLETSPITNDKGDYEGAIAGVQDITERKQAEKALRESEEKFRNLAEQSPNMIFINRKGRIVYANERCEEIMGYKIKEFYSPDFDFLTLIYPESKELIKSSFKKHLSGKEIPPYEYSLVTKKGKKIEAIITTKLINYDREKALLGIITDISERKKAEKALQESEERYRMLAENSVDVIYRLDENLQITYVSPSVKRLLGYTPEEHIKQPREGFYTPASLKLFQATVRERLGRIKSGSDKHKPIKLELEVKHKNGSTLWIETRANPLYDDKNNFKGLIGISRDITERKRLEEKLNRYRASLEELVKERTEELSQKIGEYKQAEERVSEAELRYRTVADFTYDWEYWEAPNGALHYVSPSVERITGFKAEEFIEDPQLIQRIILPEDIDTWKEHHREMRKKKRQGQFQFRIKRRDGEVRWIEHACRAVRDDKNKFLGFRASNRDITQRKLAQTEAQHHRQELSHVGRVATIGELTAALAHELNQPLTAILSNTQAGQRFLEAESPDLDELRDILSAIVTENKRASEVIKRIRALLKREKMAMKPININEVIQEVASLTKSDAVIRNIEVTLDLAPQLPDALGDRIQIQQIILNLMVNGFEAMTLQKSQPRELVISSNLHKKKMIKIDVQDTGTGIKKENTEKIFEPFFTTKSTGMGMGLSINKSIIEAHGGKIWARNNPVSGATFSFILPLNKEDLK